MKDSETTQEIYVDSDFIAAWDEYDVRHLAYDLDDAVWLMDNDNSTPLRRELLAEMRGAK